MKKVLISAVVFALAVTLSLAQERGRSERGSRSRGQQALANSKTMLSQLTHTDGAQALVAAVQVVDGSGVCPVRIAELLDTKQAKLVLLAPSNEAFEGFLGLRQGALQGLDSVTLAILLPSILANIGLDAEDVCDVLLKHIAVIPNGPIPSTKALLTTGAIAVADGSTFPVAIGPKGPWINREGTVVEPDVFTQNGVIHFLDSVIQDVPSVSRIQVFVTSNAYNGNLGNGIEGGDAKCSSVANHVNLPGTWTAWLSADDGSNARERTQDGEYQLLDGTVVANSLADLTDGTLDHPINIDENGSLLDGVSVWTGTSVAGSLEGDTCPGDAGSWRRLTDDSEGQVGDSSLADAGWTNAGTSSCAESSHLYCFAAAETDSGNEPPPDVDLPSVCGEEWCASDRILAEKCMDFLDQCLTELGVTDQQCVAGAYFICRDNL